MEKQIWKFEIDKNNIIIEMPKDAEILTVQPQNGQICIWALVTPDNVKESRYFEVYATGHTIRYDMGVERKYIGTIQIDGGSWVWHLFERLD